MTETSPPALAVATSDRVRLAMRAAADTKAEEIRVLSLATVADFADYFLFASGANERQVQAIADRIEEQLREAGARPLHVEGQAAEALDRIDAEEHSALVAQAPEGVEVVARAAPELDRGEREQTHA